MPTRETDIPALPRKERHPINIISVSGVLFSLRDGLRDFQKATIYGLFLGRLHAAFGWLLVYLMIGLDFGSYVYPMVTGFGPVDTLHRLTLVDHNAVE